MNPVTLVHESILHSGIRLPFFCYGTSFALDPLGSAAVSSGGTCWHFIVDISLLLFIFHSHNTKTTTWLDPRLAKKAKPPEKCEDGGM